MSTTVPGGIYEGPKGRYHNANNETIPAEQVPELLARMKALKINPPPVVIAPPPVPEAPAPEPEPIPASVEEVLPPKRVRKPKPE
jgi:outer membrane biosynthesis protein TonB